MYKSLPPNKAFFVRRASSILESGRKKIEPTAQAYSNDDEQLLKKLRGPIFFILKKIQFQDFSILGQEDLKYNTFLRLLSRSRLIKVLFFLDQALVFRP